MDERENKGREEGRNGQHDEPATRQGFADANAGLERAMRLAQPPGTTSAPPEAMLLTMTIASLMPVIQATMSFVLAATNTYNQMHSENAAMAGTNMPLLAESARRILASSTPAPTTVAQTRETTVTPQPQTLVVT